jgi:predicted Zn-dependent protease with MMP-like domain
VSRGRSPRRQLTDAPLSIEDVCTITLAAMGHLPEEILAVLRDVEIIVVDSPAAPELRHVRDADGNLLGDFLGFYSGTAIAGDDAEEVHAAPLGIIWLNAAQLHDEEEVSTTLYHEIGHALGLTEDEVAALGLE